MDSGHARQLDPNLGIFVQDDTGADSDEEVDKEGRWGELEAEAEESSSEEESESREDAEGGGSWVWTTE